MAPIKYQGFHGAGVSALVMKGMKSQSAASAATLWNVSVFGVQFRQRRHLQQHVSLFKNHLYTRNTSGDYRHVPGRFSA